MPRKTIKNRIIFTSLGGVGLLLLLIGLASFWFISNWLAAEFDANLLTKAQVLATLFEENEEGLELNFADEFMPEFERLENPEYFQFWLSSSDVFERSNSLGENDLLQLRQGGDLPQFVNLDLLDGQRGRMIQLRFIPQLDEKLRTAQRQTSDEEVTLVVAREKESLNTMISVVAVVISAAIPAIIVLIYLTIRYSVDSSLKPLEELKAQISHLNTNNLSQRIKIRIPVLDLEGLIDSFNAVLNRIEEGFKREQRFTDDAAHELRTPIAELLSTAEIAKKWPEKVSSKELVDDVIGSGHKMHLIVDSLLKLARCKNGQVQLNPTSVILMEEVGKICLAYKEQARQRNITIEFDANQEGVRRDPVLIYISAVELELVLRNLISNAVEYCDAGSTLNIKVLRQADSIMLQFSNKTENLQQEDIPLLFDSLWRKDSSRSSDDHIGLGLTLVKAYAELLNLEIEATLERQWFSITLAGFTAARDN